MPADISQAANIKTFGPGAVVTAEGPASPKEMLVVLQGNLGVYKNFGLASEVQCKVIGPGSFYGEQSLFLNMEQAETLVALSNAAVMFVSRRNIRDFFTGQPDMALTIVEGICKKLFEAEAALAKFIPQAAPGAPSAKSALFPEGHGSYSLLLPNDNADLIYTSKFTCPLCGYTFDNLAVILSKLRPEKTDPDLRVHYKDVDPLYYEIITCPSCLFSASGESFPHISKKFADAVNQAVGPFTLGTRIETGAQRDTFTLFAGYYLAIICAPIVFDSYQLVTANLWLKLSRLYQDVGDAKMRLYASEKSLEDYHYAYEHLNISEKQSQQICYIIGDLYERKGDFDAAKNFFFLAKTAKLGTTAFQRQADLRLENIRENKKQ